MSNAKSGESPEEVAAREVRIVRDPGYGDLHDVYLGKYWVMANRYSECSSKASHLRAELARIVAADRKERGE